MNIIITKKIEILLDQNKNIPLAFKTRISRTMNNLFTYLCMILLKN